MRPQEAFAAYLQAAGNHRDLFRARRKKDGGRYVTAAGRVKKVRAAEREIELTDGRHIAFERLLALEGAVFDALE